MSQARVLVVDDEPAIVRVVRAYLEREGYLVETASDGPAALEIARRFDPDLVILDLMLPGIDGFQLCERLRRETDVPVLMLTARKDETDKVAGLTLGADDYVTKPFSPRELVARVKAILRRAHPTGASTRWHFHGLTIDLERRTVWVQGREVELTPREFDVLRTLARRPGHVLTREQILEVVWGADYYGDPRVVDVHVAQIRRKLGEGGGPAGLIETMRGVGYRFQPPVG